MPFIVVEMETRSGLTSEAESSLMPRWGQATPGELIKAELRTMPLAVEERAAIAGV